MWTFLSPLKKNTKALLTRKVTTVYRNEAIIKVPIKNGQISNYIFFHKLVGSLGTIRCQINVPVRFEKNFWGWGGGFAWVWSKKPSEILGGTFIWGGTIFFNIHSPLRRYDFWISCVTLWSKDVIFFQWISYAVCSRFIFHEYCISWYGKEVLRWQCVSTAHCSAQANERK